MGNAAPRVRLLTDQVRGVYAPSRPSLITLSGRAIKRTALSYKILPAEIFAGILALPPAHQQEYSCP